ncbi:UNVERIFIED_CONTAM: hypothetical protein FKN15_021376 [Acipenser sinensis]
MTLCLPFSLLLYHLCNGTFPVGSVTLSTCLGDSLHFHSVHDPAPGSFKQNPQKHD